MDDYNQCREYRQKMVPFVKKTLPDIENIKLLRHTGECKGCKEELKIQFLVREGLNRLETGGNFNIESDFTKQMEEMKRESMALIFFRRMGYFLEGILCVLGLLFLVYAMLGRL